MENLCNSKVLDTYMILYITLPSLIVGGGLINRGRVGSPPDIGNLGNGYKLKWVDICETSVCILFILFISGFAKLQDN